MVSDENYERYVREYADMVLRIAVNYCKRMADAEDIVQEVFLHLYEAEKPFRDEEHVKRWLIRVTVNTCRNYLGSAWRRRVEAVAPGDMEQTVPGSVPDMEEEDSQLYLTVSSLPEKYRTVVHLYYYEEYSVREIASILQKKESTVKARLMRARNMLKERLKGAWRDES